MEAAKQIESIRQLYTSREGRLAPFSWCEHFYFHLDDIFTRLVMVSKEKEARGTGARRNLEFTEIFQAHKECEEPKKVLIEGKPGMGKTTYCNKLVYDWATKKNKSGGCFPDFQLVLLLRCRDIGVESNLRDAIDDQLLPRGVQSEDREKFMKFIQNNQSKVLMVLEGLDELPKSRLPEFIAKIIQGRMLPGCHLVVTARHEAGIPVRKVCDTLLEIEGFNPEDVKNFILKYFKGKNGLSRKLLDKLESDSRLREMSTNPLNTALLCLLCEDFDGVLPEGRTQLYLQIVLCVLMRYREKKGLPEDNTDLTELYKDQLKHLGSIALNGLHEECMYFGKKQLGQQHSDLPGFGFLSVQPGSKLRPFDECYGFTHKSFQEFFAGHYLWCQLVSQEITPQTLVCDARYFRNMRQLLLFTCGLLALRSEESVGALTSAIANEVNKGDLTELLPVALECIKECKKGDSNLHLQLARTFGSRLTVQKAYLGGERIDVAAAEVLGAALETNTTLTDLSLSLNNLGPDGAKSLADMLKTNTILTDLHLSANDLGPAGAESVTAALGKNTTLKHLDLSANELGPAGAESVAKALEKNRTLRALNLSGNNLGSSSADSLSTALETNTSLTALNLSGNNLGPVGARSFAAALKMNKTLTELNLSGNNIGPTGVESLAAILVVAGGESVAANLTTNKTLTNLDLSANYLGPAGAESLAAMLITNKTLISLDLSTNGLAPAGAESLAAAIETNTTLKALNLSRNNLGPTGADSLAAALEINKSLTELNLSGNNLGPEIAQLFSVALEANKTLTDFNLSSNNLGPAGAASLATALEINKTLTYLDLSYINDLGPAGAESLAGALKTNRTLTGLNLSGNNLGPTGAESLAAALETNRTLTKLNLSDNTLGPSGAESFATILETNATLTDLDLSYNDFCPDSDKLIAAALERRLTNPAKVMAGKSKLSGSTYFVLLFLIYFFLVVWCYK